MEQRPFGSTKREVAVIGQGTWYIDNADRVTAIAALVRMRAGNSPTAAATKRVWGIDCAQRGEFRNDRARVGSLGNRQAQARANPQ